LRPGVVENQDMLPGQIEILWEKRELVGGEYPRAGGSHCRYQPR
jgi:hypothetical protein